MALNCWNGVWNSPAVTLVSFGVFAGLPAIFGLPLVLICPLASMPVLSVAEAQPVHPSGTVFAPVTEALPATLTVPCTVTAALTLGFTVTVRSTIASDWVVPFRVPTDLSRNRLLLSLEMVTLKYVPFATESWAIVVLASVARALLPVSQLATFLTMPASAA